MIGLHSVTLAPDPAHPETVVDLSCLVDSVAIRHGRDNPNDQPDASSCTVDLSWPADLEDLPTGVEPGSLLTVTTTRVATTGEVVRFTGTVTDLNVGWEEADEDTPFSPVAQIIAVGPMANLGRRVVGDEPWPQELDGARAARILTLAGANTDAARNDPGRVEILPRDVDAQPALDLIQSVGDDSGGILWETRDGFVLYADAEHRRNTVPALTIDACAILVTPTWAKSTAGLINRVSVGYGVDPEGGEQPRVLVSRDDSIARYGLFDYSTGTELATLADAEARATMLTTRNAFPYWDMRDLPLDMGGLDPVTYDTILDLDTHDLVELTGLPAVGTTPVTASLWVEGIEETLAYGVHEYTLSVSGYCRTAPPPRWNDVDPAATWDSMGSTTWDQAACFGPQPSRGRWDDVSASLRWDQVDPATTWDEWKG